ncbi:protein CHROMATIN REMODELING 25-like, partial [Rosa rugosa]|uniref:protein CHROMATIN REMODELING 25-like n=1 Tax=Rosa rugosa TaxID=74645 RepID=UPI002B417588
RPTRLGSRRRRRRPRARKRTRGSKRRRTRESSETQGPPSASAAVRKRSEIEECRCSPQPLLPRVLSVTEGATVCRKPFKPPCSKGYDDGNDQLARRLSARRRFVPWGGSSSAPFFPVIERFPSLPNDAEKDVVEEIVTLPPGIDPLVLWQPEEFEDGDANMVQIVVDPLLVRFLRPHQREGVQFMFDCVAGLNSAANIHGCILADDMGLGKTLQSITLLYTLLYQGFDGKSMVKKAIIVTPTSLVSNWEAPIKKWVGDRVCLIALCESTRDDVVSGIDQFTSARSRLQFILRRTNALLSNHLPLKIIEVVCCKLTPLQLDLYNHFIHSKNVKRAISEDTKQTKILAYITALKKLCNHPKLIYDTIKSGNPGSSSFEDCIRFFPPQMFSGRSGSWIGGDGAWVELSGKMHVLARLLAQLRKKTDDRIVLVSNYTHVMLCNDSRT